MDSKDRLFGEIAVRLKLLTREQLSMCIREQQAHPQRKRIGQIAREMAVLTPTQIDFILQQQERVLERRRALRGSDGAEIEPHAPQSGGGAAPTADRARRAAAPPPPPTADPTGETVAAMEATDPTPAERTTDQTPYAERTHTGVALGRTRLTTARKLRARSASSQGISVPPAPPAEPQPPRRASGFPPPAPDRPLSRPPSDRAKTAADNTMAEPHSPAPSSRTEAAGAPASNEEPFLVRALRLAADKGASDLHLHSGAPLKIRIGGALTLLHGDRPIREQAAEKVVAQIMTDEQWDLLAKHGELDFAFEVPGVGRQRVNAYRQQRGLDVVFRMVPERPPSLEALGLPESLRSMLDFRTGIVLCTGPAGCGKSTTMAALMQALVAQRKEHVITIEDPIEFVYRDAISVVNQRQIGAHTQSFARALRAALREDPDVIAITELRDRETMALAMSAAETGHLVFGTLHTGNAAQTVNRIISMFPADQQAQIRVMLSESLRAVISQRLVRRADGKGRQPALEILKVTPAVSNLIRDDKTFQIPSVIQTGKAHGMIALDDSLRQLVHAGTIELEEAKRHAVAKDKLG